MCVSLLLLTGRGRPCRKLRKCQRFLPSRVPIETNRNPPRARGKRCAVVRSSTEPNQPPEPTARRRQCPVQPFSSGEYLQILRLNLTVRQWGLTQPLEEGSVLRRGIRDRIIYRIETHTQSIPAGTYTKRRPNPSSCNFHPGPHGTFFSAIWT